MILNLGGERLKCRHKCLINYSYEYCSLHDLWGHIVIINQGRQGATFGKSRTMDDCGMSKSKELILREMLIEPSFYY
jgi:hypothetical protein